MTAAGAETVEFESVGLDGKAVAGGDFILQFLDLTIFKFNNLAATRADEVIVMAFVRDVIVLRLRAKVSGLGDTRVAKQV